MWQSGWCHEVMCSHGLLLYSSPTCNLVAWVGDCDYSNRHVFIPRKQTGEERKKIRWIAVSFHLLRGKIQYVLYESEILSLFFLSNLSALLFNRSSRHFLDWLYRVCVCVCVCFVHTNDSLALVEPRISILALRKKPYNGSQVFRFTGLPMSLYPFKPFRLFWSIAYKFRSEKFPVSWSSQLGSHREIVVDAPRKLVCTF